VRLRIALISGLALIASVCSADEIVSPETAQPIPEFTLADHRGKEWSLTEFKQHKLMVITVVGTECPLVQKSLPQLQRLDEEFRKQGVAFIGINANRQDSLAEIGAQVRTADLTFPILKDNQQVVISALQATRTPEVFVLDDLRRIRYRGRIDDQHAVGNRSKSKPVREDLRIALEELLAGNEVSVPKTDAVGCLITRAVPVRADAEVTYSNQIAQLLQRHCVECHRPGEIAPFSLTDYQEIAGWAEMLVEVTQSGQMPPWHAAPEHGRFQNARGLTADEKQLLADWAAAGAPEGDLADLPAPPTFTTGWQLPREPDLVVEMRAQPFRVPAEGTVKYQYFKVDPKLTEEKWIQAAEVVPGNRAVVHHVIVFTSGSGKQLDAEHSFLTAFVPGLRIKPLPEGYAKRLPAGSQLIFQVHYTSNGTPQDDLTKIGLVFVDEATVTHEVRTESIKSRKLVIQPQLDDQRFEASPVVAPLDMELIALAPHMHLRGKSFRYELLWPDGRREVLLDVPNYDFNWQTSYRLETPLKIPQGATLHASASYDNSVKNLANPDSSQTVTWGEQSWDEMMLAYFDIAFPRTDAAQQAAEQLRGVVKPQDQAAGLMKLLDRNRNGTIERAEVRERQLAIFDRIDKDRNDIVTAEELAAGMVLLRNAVKPQR